MKIDEIRLKMRNDRKKVEKTMCMIRLKVITDRMIFKRKMRLIRLKLRENQP